MRELTFDEMDIVSGGYGGSEGGSLKDVEVKSPKATSGGLWVGNEFFPATPATNPNLQAVISDMKTIAACTVTHLPGNLVTFVSAGTVNGAWSGALLGTGAGVVPGAPAALTGAVTGATAGVIAAVLGTPLGCAWDQWAPEGLKIP
jgi:hypothetical protein